MRALGDEYFRALVRSRGAALMRTAYLLTGARQPAEDLVETALARTALHWQRLPAPEAAEDFVRRAMYREQVSRWRRRTQATRRAQATRPHVPEQRPPGADGTVPERRSPDAHAALFAALRQLSTRQRAFLVLRFHEDLDELEAAELLGVSAGTVRSQTDKALQRLREYVDERPAHRVTPTGDRP